MTKQDSLARMHRKLTRKWGSPRSLSRAKSKDLAFGGPGRQNLNRQSVLAERNISAN